MKPSAIDLFCGLGGWAEGLLAEGYDVIGFDIERHVELGPENPEQCAKMLADLAESLRADATRSPLDQLINEKAIARRLRVEEIARMAE